MKRGRETSPLGKDSKLFAHCQDSSEGREEDGNIGNHKPCAGCGDYLLLHGADRMLVEGTEEEIGKSHDIA